MADSLVPWGSIVTGILVNVMVLGIALGFWKWHKRSQSIPQQDLWNSLFSLPSTTQPTEEPSDKKVLGHVVGLGVFRLCSCIYHACVHFTLIVDDWSIYRFYTIWNYTMLIIYFGLAASWSLKGILFYRQYGHFRSNDPIGFFGISQIVLFEITCTMVILVDTVLWGILFPWAKAEGDNLSVFLNFWSYNQHGTNFLFMAIEFIFASHPFFPSDILFVFVWALAYLICTWTIRAINPTIPWPYPFLETRNWDSPLWYAGMCLLHVIFFYLCYGLYRLKVRLLGRAGSEGQPSNITTTGDSLMNESDLEKLDSA